MPNGLALVLNQSAFTRIKAAAKTLLITTASMDVSKESIESLQKELSEKRKLFRKEMNRQRMKQKRDDVPTTSKKRKIADDKEEQSNQESFVGAGETSAPVDIEKPARDDIEIIDEDNKVESSESSDESTEDEGEELSKESYMLWYNLNDDCTNTYSTYKLFIENKIRNKPLTNDDILSIHNQYLKRLYDTYQAQPQTHDECERLRFVSSMVTHYPLYADGELLWRVIPAIPESKPKYDQFVSGLFDIIEKIYEELVQEKIPLDVVSKMIILAQFFNRNLFTEALRWVVKNSNENCESIRFVKFYDFI
ncbi:uncharacterized protein [Watersipora subatra]|uniref:uncharacterized protein isoform X1 n=1 Tax=Watersipora subatra TaxID=2589382 RepID=UPI00355C02E2